MVRPVNERILVIGDSQRELQSAVLEALPGSVITHVPTLFDGLAELSTGTFSAILAAAEPLERRPEAAVRTLRELAGDARLMLFGHPTLEILSQKMLQFGCDDYIITPAAAAEFKQIFGTPPMRLAEVPADSEAVVPAPEAAVAATLASVPLAEIILDALLNAPQDALAVVANQVNARIAPELELRLTKPNEAAPQPPDGQRLISHAIRNGAEDVGILHLLGSIEQDEVASRHGLSQIAAMMGKLATLQDRHNRLQKLAITDELTGSYNCRYFRHFLTSILDRARRMHFPVTLLLFDIDDFKKYNDQFGHATGDEILKQAAALMKRCTRQHDLVARIGGDEFAVVFWDKEGPRQPRDPRPGVSSRPPQEPLQVFDRFRRLIATEEFPSLGPTGLGTLTVSAGLAVFPWDATDPDALIKEADKRLMMGAKKNGKNAISIVGGDGPPISA